jgi:hypothetical protein
MTGSSRPWHRAVPVRLQARKRKSRSSKFRAVCRFSSEGPPGLGFRARASCPRSPARFAFAPWALLDLPYAWRRPGACASGRLRGLSRASMRAYPRYRSAPARYRPSGAAPQGNDYRARHRRAAAQVQEGPNIKSRLALMGETAFYGPSWT